MIGFVGLACLCAFPALVIGTNLSAASDVLQMAPCSSTNPSTTPCISSNNCSRRVSTESCSLVLLVPPQDGNAGGAEINERGATSFEELPPQDGNAGGVEINEHRTTSFEVWMMGCLSVGIISLSGITGAVLWPILQSPYYPHVLTALIGLAVGSLSSTALFQLIPEAFQIASHDESLNYLMTALCGWFSIWLIYFIEGVSKILFSKAPIEKNKKVVSVEWSGAEETLQLKESHDYASNCHDAMVDQIEKTKKVNAVAWMIIFGDGIHNFIDGVTIGAGYTQSIGTGVGLSLAIACEEFPHELGDFAILLQSGMSLKKAMCYNFLSACTAFLGLVLGILLGGLEGSHYIFAFAGSLFLYISLGHLIPELKADIKKCLKESRRKAALFFLLQNVGIIVGACLIFTITKYNETITNLF